MNLDDFIQTDANGRGFVNVLAADRLMQSPRVYATLLLWLLSELFERLPEVGDPPKPKLVFFFDEAHLLFNEIEPALLEKIEQVVRLVRSEGVGVYFITQNPRDVPDNVLGQLGNRVQHALRAFTPRDQKAVRTAAETFRVNPALDTAQAIMELGVGDALVSCLDEKGQPQIVQRALILPPRSQLGPISQQQRQQIVAGSIVAGVYDQVVDRESAYEKLTHAVQQAPAAAPQPTASGGGFWGSIFGGGGSRRRRHCRAPFPGADEFPTRWRQSPRRASYARSAAQSAAALGVRSFAAFWAASSAVGGDAEAERSQADEEQRGEFGFRAEPRW